MSDLVDWLGSPPILIRFMGPGFSGYWIVPNIDDGYCITSINKHSTTTRLGVRARYILANAPYALLPPVEREDLDSWFLEEKKSDRKVIDRLANAGLVWKCERLKSLSSLVEYDALCSLTPLGYKVFLRFEDEIRNGKRVRWNKLDFPTFSTPEYWEELTSLYGAAFPRLKFKKTLDLESVDTSREETSREETKRPKKKDRREELNNYGTSAVYRVSRIDTVDRFWNPKESLRMSYMWDWD